MPKERKKKTWREEQQERQAKQQRTYQEYQAQRERDQKNKPLRNLNRIFLGVALIAVIVTAVGIWQYYEGQKPPTIGDSVSGEPEASPSTGSAPNFSLKDINGTQVSLSKFSGNVIGIHFMAVGCSGQIYPINEYQLTQLSSVCNSLCGEENATFLTVVVATCENSELDVLRSNYDVTWTIGNDYDDGTLEIVNAYVPFEIGDGAVVLIDKTFNVAQVYRGGVAAETLSSKINQLLEA